MSRKTTLAAGACALAVILPGLAFAQTGENQKNGELTVTVGDLRFVSIDTPAGTEDGAAIEARVLAVDTDLPIAARIDVDLLKAGDISIGEVEGRLFHRSDRWGVGAMAGLRDIGGAPNVATYGAEASYFGDAVTLSGGAYRQESMGAAPDAARLEAGATFYPHDRVSLTAPVGRVDPEGAAEYDIWGVGAQVPIADVGSLTLGFDQSPDTDAEVVSIGFRLGGGSGSIQERDQNRAGGGPDRLFKSPF